jgi:hypothetical protein
VGDMREQSGSKVRYGVGYGLELLEDWIRCEGFLRLVGRFLPGPWSVSNRVDRDANGCLFVQMVSWLVAFALDL